MAGIEPGSLPKCDENGNIVLLDDPCLVDRPFGGKVAEQVGAYIELDDDDRQRPLRTVDDESEDKHPFKPAGFEEKLETMDFDDRLEATMECLTRRPSFQDILYGLLGFCASERSYEEIELYVKAFPEFTVNRQEPRRYVFMLLRTGALQEIELGEDGAPLTEDDVQKALDDGIEPDDLDTLVFDWRVITTEVGEAAYQRFSPAMRFKELLADNEGHDEALYQIMEFCRVPRYMGQIDDRFKGKPVMGFNSATSMMYQPSSYVTKLNHAGVLNWNGDQWQLTESGAELLNMHNNES